MTTPITWRKSSCSGGGEGNDCVEIATTHVTLRESKAPTRAALTFPAPAFNAFVDALKAQHAGAVGG
ncbi:DUF397 domain-containing protein [Streptomyces sp. NPDC056160]|uniref:DUF397 domain-containing protein n=1 Tax=Streptomyces sp. NPDC056160 TaxID=3345731 RepID=UPI0035DE95C3